jgi:hypothetical protein
MGVELSGSRSNQVYIRGDGDNTIVSPKIIGNSRYGVDIQGAGTNKLLTDVNINNNGRDGIFSNSPALQKFMEES